MAAAGRLPDDMVFFTQITMEAAEDPEFLDAMRRARISGALVGVESVTPEGLKDIYKDFNLAGRRARAGACGTFRRHGMHVLGSFIFGLPSDRPETFEATAALAERADITFAQFVHADAVPRHGRLRQVGRRRRKPQRVVDGDARSRRHWLIPQERRPNIYIAASRRCRSTRSGSGTQAAWDRFYSLPPVWAPIARACESLKSPPGVRADLEALPPDVRQHRHRHRQRPEGRAERWARLLASRAAACSRLGRCPTCRRRAPGRTGRAPRLAAPGVARPATRPEGCASPEAAGATAEGSMTASGSVALRLFRTKRLLGRVRGAEVLKALDAVREPRQHQPVP